MAIDASAKNKLINLEGLEHFESKLPKNIELTQAEFDALPGSKYTDGNIYFITDAKTSVDGADVTYDNTASGLDATTAQDAIDEVNSKFTYATDTQINDLFASWV